MGIAGFTGTRGAFVDDFIKKNKIDARKLFNFVRKGNLRDRMDFVTAIAGKPNNKFFKMIVGRFAESINEVLVIVDKFDKNKQDYGKIYYRDGGNRPGDGDIKKANKELAKLSKKHKGLTLVSVGRNSKMYDVNNPRESVNEEFKSKDSTFEKVYGIFDKRDYFNNKGFAKTQIGNFERALQKKDKGAQKISVSYTHLTLPTNREV